MKDFIEMMEDAAERRLIEQTKGCLPGEFRCGCGRTAKIEDAQPYSDNPYSEPICENCWLEWATKHGYV